MIGCPKGIHEMIIEETSVHWISVAAIALESRPSHSVAANRPPGSVRRMLPPSVLRDLCPGYSATWTLYKVPPRGIRSLYIHIQVPAAKTFLLRAPHIIHTPSCKHECATSPAEDGQPRVSGRPRAQAMISPFFGGHHQGLSSTFRTCRRPAVYDTVVPWLRRATSFLRDSLVQGPSVELCGTRDDDRAFSERGLAAFGSSPISLLPLAV